MMFRLPPPPRFTLPPPPKPSSDIFDRKLLSQLTCSSIRQQHRLLTNPRLIAISSISFLIVLFLCTLLFMLIHFYRRQRSSDYSNTPKPLSTLNMKPKNSTMYTSRSYESISSQHTGVYVESIDTSATTFSTDQTNVICLYCHRERVYSNASLPPYYHTLDTLSS
ncbi:unnamed protein product [Rotaria magnacalcarata]|uniref:Uncharacterized protein n=2 Tax=Rotaria magnacalcarata TaxID=392030 RepID=A0A818ZZK5_9BILA|nr:unnamed protein product [Rotaria magnacalcarata]CAF3770915.1 unnamed protein product [Rotaria magnacalcarata]CAF4870552.1 unnamed protein product [Rotaria magnacalcarata]